MLKRRIPLAWKQLTKERGRMMVAIAGIAFADVLMFLQMGFRSALFNGAVQVHNVLDGDIFLVSDRYKALISLDRFTERRLYQALGFAGVESVSPVYLSPVQWKNPENQQVWNLYAIGVNPADQTILLPEIRAKTAQLKQPDTVLFDAGARKEFGRVPQLFESGNLTTEVENRRVDVVGLFKLGTSFGINGHLITSDLNFLRMFRERRQKGLIDVGVVRLKPDANLDQVLQNLRSNLPNDVRIMSKSEFMNQEKNFWNTSTPVGYVFDLGAVIGFIVGAVVVYQILYSDVSDHLPEYATLKAIGFNDRYLLSVVFQEALILACIGFLPGFAISLGFYQVTRQATLLPMVMTVGRALFVLMLTAVMCTISAAISVRKLRSADPADIF